jgi:ATP-binding protein involved in chromosome partitioning
VALALNIADRVKAKRAAKTHLYDPAAWAMDRILWTPGRSLCDYQTEVLGEIQDPELHRGLNELNIVRRIDVDGATVKVLIALSIPGCPLKDYFYSVIPAKLTETFPAVEHVAVELTSMTEEERQALVGGIRQEAPAPFANPDSRTRVIAVGSGKGGVGKSTTTVNLAASLAKLGHSVGLLDADVCGFSIPRMLGVHERPTVVDNMVMAPEVFGVKVVSIGLFTNEDNPVVWRGPMLHKALQQFLGDVYWGDLDFLLIDMPPGTGDVSLSLASFLPGGSMIVVTTPQDAASKVAERAGRMAQHPNVKLKLIGVIENMAGFVCPHCGERSEIFGYGGGERTAEKYEVALLGQIPIEGVLPVTLSAEHRAGGGVRRDAAR